MKYLYTDPETTPMKFTEFIKIMSVIAAIAQTVRLIGLFQQDATAFEIIYSVLSISFALATVFGLCAMKWYGVVTFYARLLLQIADAVLGIIVSLILHVDYSLIGECAGVIVGALIWLIPSWVYFRKRRLLFDPWPKGVERPGGSQPEPDTEPASDPEAPLTQRFCRKCGGRLLPESLYCSHCGAALTETVGEENVL